MLTAVFKSLYKYSRIDKKSINNAFLLNPSIIHKLLQCYALHSNKMQLCFFLLLYEHVMVIFFLD